ncbi:MAG: hypothetical protein IT518_15010 [Burkholderiales bacterium]|nr:hypothetical protein [Burkholderiales bacterium]
MTMTTRFMESYAELLVKTCYRRNIHAMGGKAAQMGEERRASRVTITNVDASYTRRATRLEEGGWSSDPLTTCGQLI